MTNSDFLEEVYGELEPGTHGWVCSFRADPSNAPALVWAGRSYKQPRSTKQTKTTPISARQS